MQTMEQLKVDFKRIHADAEIRNVRLDSLFFEQLDQEEINGGNVNVRLILQEKDDVYIVEVNIVGNVIVSCDRCMADLQLPVNTSEVIKFKYGEEDHSDTNNYEYIHDLVKPYDLSWLIYEIVEVSLPISRVHPDGECDERMMEILKQYSSN